MKRFLLAFCVAVLSAGAYAQNYYSDYLEELYPIAGLGLWHRKYTVKDDLTPEKGGKFRVGANIGVGFQYDITENIAANIQYKYFITNDYGHSVFGLGMIYRF